MLCGRPFRGLLLAYHSAGPHYWCRENFIDPSRHAKQLWQWHLSHNVVQQQLVDEKQGAALLRIDSWPDHPRFMAFWRVVLVSDRDPMLLD